MRKINWADLGKVMLLGLNNILQTMHDVTNRAMVCTCDVNCPSEQVVISLLYTCSAGHLISNNPMVVILSRLCMYSVI